MKKVFSLLLSLALVFSMALPASAAGFGSVTFNYSNGTGSFSFKPGSSYTATDLFDNFKDVMPGDTRELEIEVKNGAWKYDYVEIYMRAVPHSETDNPLTYSESYENTDGKDQAGIEGKRDETVATMTDFLKQLHMTVENSKSKTIFDASPAETDGLKKNVLIATLNRGKSTTLTVTLEVPIELGNEYANRVGEVDWVFTVQGYNTDNPKTGDQIMLAVGVMAISAAAIVILIVAAKKKKKK